MGIQLEKIGETILNQNASAVFTNGELSVLESGDSLVFLMRDNNDPLLRKSGEFSFEDLVAEASAGSSEIIVLTDEGRAYGFAVRGSEIALTAVKKVDEIAPTLCSSTITDGKPVIASAENGRLHILYGARLNLVRLDIPREVWEELDTGDRVFASAVIGKTVALSDGYQLYIMDWRRMKPIASFEARARLGLGGAAEENAPRQRLYMPSDDGVIIAEFGDNGKLSVWTAEVPQFIKREEPSPAIPLAVGCCWLAIYYDGKLLVYDKLLSVPSSVLNFTTASTGSYGEFMLASNANDQSDVKLYRIVPEDDDIVPD